MFNPGLEGTELKRICSVIESSFSFEELDHLLKTYFKDLSATVERKALRYFINEVIAAADRRGLLDQLLTRLAEVRPAREDLQTIAGDYSKIKSRLIVAPAPGAPAELRDQANVERLVPEELREEVWSVAVEPWSALLGRAVRRAGLRPFDPETEGHRAAALQLRSKLSGRGEPADVELVDTGLGILRRPVRFQAPIADGAAVIADLLAELRISSRLAPLGDTVSAGIWTHNPFQYPRGAALAIGDSVSGLLRFAVDGAQLDVRQRWGELILDPLHRLRRIAAGRARSGGVHFEIKAHVGVAVVTGAIFHTQTGVRVSCEQNGEIWSMEPRPGVRVHLDARVTEDARSDQRLDEVHLLISIAQDVRPAYEQWRNAQLVRTPARVVSIAPGHGPSREAVSAGEVAAIGDAVFSIVARHRQAGNRFLPARLFVAAPVSAAMAVGRAIRSYGELIVMDYDREKSEYFESFRLRV